MGSLCSYFSTQLSEHLVTALIVFLPSSPPLPPPLLLLLMALLVN